MADERQEVGEAHPEVHRPRMADWLSLVVGLQKAA
jgi:hypothetical protein